MKQTITIDVPEGKELKQMTDKDGNLVIQYVDKEAVRSKSWEEFCKNHPVIQNEWFYDSFNKLCFQHNTSRITKSLLSSKDDADGILALIQLSRLYDEWIGNWKRDPNTLVAIIYRTAGDDIRVGNKSYEQRLLQFPSIEMAEEFLKCFEDLIKKAKKFI